MKIIRERRKKILWTEMEIIPFIHCYPLGWAHGRSHRHFMNKVHQGLFFATSNEVIWPKMISSFMHGLKSAILAIFQKSPDWLDFRHRSGDRWVLGHFYSMKNQLWTGLDSRAVLVEKQFGPIMSNFWAPFFSCFHRQKINLIFFESIVGSALKSFIE